MDVSALYQDFLSSTGVCTDTREASEGKLFFALKGERFDGNQFAQQAIEKGCALAIIDNADYSRLPNTLLVDNSLEALTKLAVYHRKQLSMPFIGITGSNGKTTTKELISAVLLRKYSTFFTKGNLNNHIGVPLSVLSVTKAHQIAVIEMGANHVGEIAALSNISLPDFGMITNIGKAHLEGFGGFENVIKAKSELYQHIGQSNGTIFRNANNPILLKQSKGLTAVDYGNPDSEVWGEVLEAFPTLKVRLHFKPITGISPLEITTKLTGTYNLDNILAAACIGRFFDVKPEDIKIAIEDYTPVNHRSQIEKTSRNTLVIDAYNANPSSMTAALENFFLFPGHDKMLILGDMLELGEEAFDEHERILKLIEEKFKGKVILVGSEFYKHQTNFTDFDFFENSDSRNFGHLAQITNYSILLKGSRGIALEKLIPLL